VDTNTALPDNDDAVLSEQARRLFAGNCTFLKGVVDISGLPAPDRVEVAFAGRSNVGKSSLLNALTGQRNLARTSNTPGRTQEINFFGLGETCYLVDLPGYGYARASKSKSKAWTELIIDYLRGRASLRRAFLLIDARHGPKPNDLEIADLMDRTAVSYQVVLTKLDKLKSGELEAVTARTLGELAKRPAAHPDLFATSATKGSGIAELRTEIVKMLQ